MSRRTHEWTVSVTCSAVLLAVSALTACGGGSGGGSGQASASSIPPASVTSPPAAVVQAEKDETPVDPTLVAADNSFGLGLLQTLVQESPGTNIAIAPTSAAMMLQIAYNGAAGTTQTAMAQTLQLGNMSVSQLNNDNAALSAALLDPDPQVTLTIANSLWVSLSSNSVSPTFISADQTYYGAEIGDLAGAPADVNAWGSAQTHGLITQILPPDTNLAHAVAILANVVYFKGAWANAFDPAQTTAAPFTLADGTETSVNMMSQTNAAFPVLLGTNFAAISLPYGQGRLSMIVVLPNTGVDFDTFVSSMTAADLQTWVGQMTSVATVTLSLPRFTTSFGQSLVTPLSTLGMGVAFEPHVGNFSGIYPAAYLSEVQHDTVVQVDETGTVAAGSTTGTISTTSVAGLNLNLEVNHPFFYAIRDNQTGALLFTGVMMNPNAG